MQHLADQMIERAVAGRGDGDDAGFCFGQRDQFLDVVRGEARVGDQHVARRGHCGDGLEVLDRVEASVLVEPGVDDLGAVGGEHQGVAVRLGLGRRCRADVAAGAGAVLDDELPSHQFG